MKKKGRWSNRVPLKIPPLEEIVQNHPGCVGLINLGEKADSLWKARLCREIAQRLWSQDCSRMRLDGQLGAYLVLTDIPLAEQRFPELLAAAAFADSDAVYDVAARLRDPAVYGEESDALFGAPISFEEPKGKSLATFMRERARGVIVFDDMQAFRASVVEELVSAADNGVVRVHTGDYFGETSTKQFVFLLTLRLPIPAPTKEQCESAVRTEESDPPNWFRKYIKAACESVAPDHLTPWLVSRCELTYEFVSLAAWERFRRPRREDISDQKLFDAPSNIPGPSEPRKLLTVENMVEDVSRIQELTPDPGRYDLFIGYSWNRESERAKWLHDQLSPRFRVFFDRNCIDPNDVAAECRKEYLVKQLRWAVHSSLAYVMFAAAMRPLPSTLGLNEQEAIRRGVATRAPNGLVVEYNWQHLEMSASGRYLVVHETWVNAVKGSDYERAFEGGSFSDLSGLLEIVLAYMRFVGAA